MSNDIVRVYCAGPLFTRKEQEEMAELACCLESRGFQTFLPQRDGLVLAKCVEALVSQGQDNETATRLSARAIFALDVYQVLIGCNALLVNLNGRVPDEGAVSEVAMAWAWEKPVIGYKADARTAFSGQDNPLVAGLFDFSLCNAMEDIARKLEEAVERCGLFHRESERRGRGQLEQDLLLGESIWSLVQSDTPIERIAEFLAGDKHTQIVHSI